MAERPKPPLWKLWPILVLVGFVGWELYEASAYERGIDSVWMGLCGAGIVLVIILRAFMRI
jgi:hypothetical protein